MLLSLATTTGGLTGNGVYFVRCAIDGKNQAAKRMVIIQ